MNAAMEGRVVPPSERCPQRPIRPELERICLKALSADKLQRYASAREFAYDLESAMRNGGWFEVKTYQPGEVMVAQGDPSHEAYLIKSGSCLVRRTEEDGSVRELRAMGPGDVFGETGVLAGKSRSATVVAQTEVHVLCISRANLMRSFADDNPIGILAKALAERFLEREQELMSAVAESQRRE
jgi:serine/threonine-protein kinase